MIPCAPGNLARKLARNKMELVGEESRVSELYQQAQEDEQLKMRVNVVNGK